MSEFSNGVSDKFQDALDFLEMTGKKVKETFGKGEGKDFSLDFLQEGNGRNCYKGVIANCTGYRLNDMGCLILGDPEVIKVAFTYSYTYSVPMQFFTHGGEDVEIMFYNETDIPLSAKRIIESTGNTPESLKKFKLFFYEGPWDLTGLEEFNITDHTQTNVYLSLFSHGKYWEHDSKDIRDIMKTLTDTDAMMRAHVRSRRNVEDTSVFDKYHKEVFTNYTDFRLFNSLVAHLDYQSSKVVIEHVDDMFNEWEVWYSFTEDDFLSLSRLNAARALLDKFYSVPTPAWWEKRRHEIISRLRIEGAITE